MLHKGKSLFQKMGLRHYVAHQTVFTYKGREQGASGCFRFRSSRGSWKGGGWGGCASLNPVGDSIGTKENIGYNLAPDYLFFNLW